MYAAQCLFTALRPGLRRAGPAALAILMGLSGAVGAQDAAPLRALESVLVESIARTEGAVVAIARDDGPIVTRGSDALDPFAPPRNVPDDDDGRGTFIPLQFGSGVLLADPADPDARLVLTTFHVAFGEGPPDIARPVKVTVRLPGNGAIVVRGTPYAADRRIDLAVLRLQLADARIAPGDLPILTLGDADDLRKGRLVVALGNPYALARDGSPSASIGIISNIGRRPQWPATDGFPRRGESIHEYGTLLTVDTRLELGASGGPLLDLDGRLIGITTALAALEGYEKSAGFAIPFDSGTRRLVAQLLNGHEAEYGFLGISPESFRWLRPDGRTLVAVRAAHVAVDSPADQAGLRNGDLILEINGRRVQDVADLMRLIGLLGPGAAAELLVQSGGDDDPRPLTARLGKWPVYDDADVVSTVPAFPGWRGAIVDYPTARQRFLSSDRLEQYRRAVVVTRVDDASPAAAAGLKSGDFIKAVDEIEVQTPAEFAAAVTAKAGPVELTLWDGRSVRIEP